MSPAYNASAVQTKSVQPCECSPQCPQCDGLMCVCRPRFFAGQLLTEVELNGVMTYIRDRNRQHNRMLGTGVVCGLEVSCDPCGNGTVTVGAGHAISPCGEDIVVCSTAQVNVCDLVNLCRDRDQSSWDCQPYGLSQTDCAQLEEEWVLYIRYAEDVSRPVTALTGATSNTTSNCNCGSHSPAKGSGCSCGGTSAGKSSAKVPSRCEPSAPCASPRRSRSYEPTCEPTLVCETFDFSVAKKVTNYRAAVTTPDAFTKCRNDLDKSLPKKPDAPKGTAEAMPAWAVWCQQTHVALPDILRRHGLHDCSLVDRLKQIPCPDLKDQAFWATIELAERAVFDVVADLLRSCLCSLILPPCPDVVDDDRVALATITLRRNPCSVKAICNWDVRRVVLTPTAMSHWLSLVRVPELLRSIVERLCCSPLARSSGLHIPGQPAMVATGVDTLEQPMSLVASLADALSTNVTGATAMSNLVDALFASQPNPAVVLGDRPGEYVLTHDVLAPLVRNAGAAWTSAPVAAPASPGATTKKPGK